MTKEQYNKWIDDTYFTVVYSENLGAIDVALNRDKTFVMVIDLITMAVIRQEIKDGNAREATAIAFAKLKGEKIPEVTDSPDYKRARYGSDYYTITIKDGKEFTDNYAEMNDEYDKNIFETNNYFHTQERAEEVLDKIKMLLRLERLHDTFCPDYVPNWSNREEEKFYIYFDYDDNEYKFCSHYIIELSPITCFPTAEVAKAVCDILNQEMKEK